MVPVAASGQGLLVAGNKPANTATIVDLATGRTLATLPTGLGPHEAAVSRDGAWAVITDYGTGPAPGNSLTVIDLASRTVAKKIDLGDYRRPHGVQFLPGDSLLVVTVEANQAVLVVQLASGDVRRAIRTDQAGSHMVSVRADGRVGYTSNIGGGSTTEVDFSTGGTRTLAVTRQPEAVAVRPDGREVWLGSNVEGTISIVDVGAWRVAATITVGERPYRVGISPDGALAVASLTASGRVRLYDVATRRVLATLDIPGANPQPVGIAFSRDSGRAYVACQGIGAVAEIDLRGRSVLRTIPVGPGPDAVAVTAGTRDK
jgi:YVTN family beta-propeller protein